MKKHLPKLILVLLTAGLVSCVTNKKLTYLQYSGTPPDTIAAVTPSNYKVLPYDNLFIRVVTPDPKWSEMFNTLPTTTYSVSVTEQSADMISYPVDGAGNISLPYAGKIAVAGKTLSNITAEVTATLKGYVADPAVTVK